MTKPFVTVNEWHASGGDVDVTVNMEDMKAYTDSEVSAAIATASADATAKANTAESNAAADATSKANAAQNNAEAFASGLNSAMDLRVDVFEKQPSWIVVAPSGGDYTTLTAALAAHTEAGARFLIKGAVVESDSADTSYMVYPTDLDTKVDARILSPAANQHIHFAKGSSLYLGSWRLLALRANYLSISSEGSVTIDLGQTPHYTGVSLYVGGATGMDFSEAKFIVNCTRAQVCNSVNTAFYRFEKLDCCCLGEWAFYHNRAVTHNLGGTTITNLVPFQFSNYIRNSKLRIHFRQFVNTAVGWTTSNVYGLTANAVYTAKTFDRFECYFNCVALPSVVGYSQVLGLPNSNLQSSGWSSSELIVASSQTFNPVSDSTGNTYAWRGVA